MPPPYTAQLFVLSYIRITSPVPTALIRTPGALRYTPDWAMLDGPHAIYQAAEGRSVITPPEAGRAATAAVIAAASVTPVVSPDGATDTRPVTLPAWSTRNGPVPDASPGGRNSTYPCHPDPSGTEVSAGAVRMMFHPSAIYSTSPAARRFADSAVIRRTSSSTANLPGGDFGDVGRGVGPVGLDGELRGGGQHQQPRRAHAPYQEHRAPLFTHHPLHTSCWLARAPTPPKGCRSGA